MCNQNSIRQKEKLIVILGPTAVGKTQLSIDLAKAVNGEIISGDSMLVYKHFDIGTAKPTVEEMNGIKHHVIDILEPWERFNVTDFCTIAKKLITQINADGKIPILAGGTGLYVKSLVEGYIFNQTSEDSAYRAYLEKLADDHGKQYVYDMLQKADPDTAQRLHINNFQRIIRALEVLHLGKERISQSSQFDQTGELVYDTYVIGLNRERAALYERINKRVDIMMASGFVKEVKCLLQKGADRQWQSMKAIGYREIAAYLNGEISLESAIDEMKKATRHFAKRQFTWYKKMPYISWYDIDGISYDVLLNKVTHDCRKFINSIE